MDISAATTPRDGERSRSSSVVRPSVRDDAVVFDFLAAAPLPPEATHFVAGVEEAAPRVGLALALVSHRRLSSKCGAVFRTSASSVQSQNAAWFPLSCGEAGAGAVLVTHELGVAIADVMMGGQGRKDSRPPSPIEMQLLSRHLTGAVRPLVPALAGLPISELNVLPPVADDLGRVLSGRELLCISIEVTLGAGADAVEGTITVGLPVKLVAASAPEPPVVEDCSPELSEALVEIPLDVSVRLAPTLVSAQDVTELAVGDFIRCGHPQTAPVLGYVDDHLVLTAFLGKRGHRRTISIDRLLEEN